MMGLKAEINLCNQNVDQRRRDLAERWIDRGELIHSRPLFLGVVATAFIAGFMISREPPRPGALLHYLPYLRRGFFAALG